MRRVTKRDYYEVLGLKKNADAAAIKKEYRKLAKQYHPDSNPGNAKAAEQFKEVTEAYSVLGDEEKRKLYDQFGHAAFDQNGAQAEKGASNGGFGNFGAGQGGFHSFHFESGADGDPFGDIFGEMFGSRGAKRSGFGGFGAGGRSYQQQGEDLNAEISVSFDDAAFGADRVITLNNASGSTQNLQVHIPAGIADGQTIRLKGKGYPGVGGGADGDLLLTVSVGERPGFERKGQDVYTSEWIPFATAVLGGEAVFHTLYGDVSCKIPAGTQCGSKIRLAGRGIVSMRDAKKKGDQYVTIQIEVPKNLSPQAKDAVEEMDRTIKRTRRGVA